MKARRRNPYASDAYFISGVQRRVLVHSILYYILNEPVVSDQSFDELSQQLVSLMWETEEEELKRTEFWYCMADFDGSTGFDLYSKLTEEHKKKYMRVAELTLGGCRKYGTSDASDG